MTRLIRHLGPLALLCGIAWEPAALAGEGLRWQLQASVPVMCAILEVQARADQPTGLAIATSCNAERYRITLHQPAGPTGLSAASSSGGAVQISGSTVTITSARPGYALTTIELAAPVSAERIAVTLQPV
jgi:hypothetical protein